MSQADQIRFTTSETRGNTLPEHATPPAGNVCGCVPNNPDNVQLPLLARMPDLDATSTPRKHRRSSKSCTAKTTSQFNRLLSANLSFQLLTGLGAFLLLMAIAPYFVTKIADIIQSKTAGELQAWQPPPPVPTADLAPTWKSETPEAEASVPLKSDPVATMPKSEKLSTFDKITSAHTTEMLAISKQASTGKRKNNSALPPKNKIALDPDTSLQSSPWPREVDQQVDFSPWPNPAQHTADRRNIPLPGGFARTPPATTEKVSGAVQSGSHNEPSAVQFEGVIETPSDRNTYDRFRPGIH